MFGIFKAAKEQLQQAKQAQVLNLPPVKQARVVNLQQAKQARVELTVALEAIGINFMKMNPIIIMLFSWRRPQRARKRR